MSDQYHCVKCKKKTEMRDPERVTTKNGKPALKGACSVCGTTVYTILGAEKKKIIFAVSGSYTRHSKNLSQSLAFLVKIASNLSRLHRRNSGIMGTLIELYTAVIAK